jgi:hypothetical protein
MPAPFPQPTSSITAGAVAITSSKKRSLYCFRVRWVDARFGISSARWQVLLTPNLHRILSKDSAFSNAF